MKSAADDRNKESDIPEDPEIVKIFKEYTATNGSYEEEGRVSNHLMEDKEAELNGTDINFSLGTGYKSLKVMRKGFFEKDWQNLPQKTASIKESSAFKLHNTSQKSALFEELRDTNLPSTNTPDGGINLNSNHGNIPVFEDISWADRFPDTPPSGRSFSGRNSL